MHRKIVWQLQISYLETFRRFIWLLRKALFLGYCASIILLLRISKLLMYCKSTNNFTTGNSLNIWLILWQFQIACLEIFRRFIWLVRKVVFCGYYASYNYFSTSHLPIICLLQNDKLFHHWKSSKSLVTVNRKIELQLQIAYLKTFQRFIWLQRKAQFLRYCASPNYLSSANRKITSPLGIVQIFDYCA